MPDAEYIRIPLRARDGSIRAHTIIDAIDAPHAEHRWHFDGRYATRTAWIDGKWRPTYLHRAVLGLIPGDGLEGDHWNGDRLDNRRSNLHIRTRAQNAQNRAANRGGTSPHRGVCWDQRYGKWEAHAKLNGKLVYLGRFADELEAAAVARAYRLAHMPFTNETR